MGWESTIICPRDPVGMASVIMIMIVITFFFFFTVEHVSRLDTSTLELCSSVE